MSLTNDQLLSALGAAIRSADQGGNTTAADLRGFLTQLLAYVQQGQDGVADQFAQKEQVGVAEGLVATERFRLDQLLGGTTDILSANHLAAKTYLIGQSKQLVLAYDDSSGALRVGTYDNSRITFNATDYEFFTKSYNRLALRLHDDSTVYVVNNLGVGTSAPTERIEVKGNVKAEQFIGDGSRLANLPFSDAAKTYVDAADQDLQQQLDSSLQFDANGIIYGDYKFYYKTTFRGLGGQTGPFSNPALALGPGPAEADNSRFVSLLVDKYGVEALALGVNKDSASGQVPANSTFLSSFAPQGSLSLGRGDGGGGLRTSDLFVAGTGQVGVGTTAPTEQLEVAGNVKATRFLGDGSQLTNLPAAKLYGSTGQATDGALTQQAVTNQLATVAHLAQDEQFTGNKTFQQAIKAAGYFGSTGVHQLTFNTIPFYDGPTFRWAGVDRVQLNFVGGQSGKNLAFVYEVRNAYLLNAGNNDVGEFYLSNPNQSNGSYHTNPRMVFFASGPATTLVRNGARLGVGTDAPSEAIETTGNVKAVRFIGDGSQLTGLPSGGSTITQLPTFTAPAGGAQTITLPRAGAAALNLQVLTADGHVATIWPGYVSISGTTLTIAADANILAGDKVAGSYY